MMEIIENELKELVFKNITFKIDSKVLKSGKLKIFNTSQFFIKFKLLINESEKEYELPYPYKLIKTDGGVIFDYTLSAFYPYKDELYYKILLCDKSGASKIHGRYLAITQNCVDKD